MQQRGARRGGGMSEYYSDGEGEEYEGEDDDYSRSGVDEEPEESEEESEEEDEVRACHFCALRFLLST